MKIIYKFLKNIFFKFKYTRLIIYLNRPQYKKFKIFNNLKEDSVFLDFGANVGEISRYVSTISNCFVYAYEPHPKAFEILKLNLLGYKKVKLINEGVGGKSKKSLLYYYLSDDQNLTLKHSVSASVYNYGNFNREINIKINSISDILKNFKYIDCIKIDIEGSEYEILPDIFKNRKKIGMVVCELHGLNESQNLEHKKNSVLKYIDDNNLHEWFKIWV